MAIDLSAWRGTVRLNAGPGSSSTANSIVATCNITSVALSKSAEGDAEVSFSFESDGDVKDNWNVATTGTVTDLKGYGGSVTLPSGFNASLSNWSANINQDTSVYSVFGSRMKRSKQATGQMTGSAAGVMKTGGTNTAPLT